MINYSPFFTDWNGTFFVSENVLADDNMQNGENVSVTYQTWTKSSTILNKS